MDNDLPDHVVVFLGDLGRLHYDEQLYWKSYNIAPVADRSSEVHFKRSHLAEFADPVSPDLVLKQKLVSLQEAWEHRFGWQLFRLLHDDDAHVLKQIRVPLSDTIAEFDHQVLLLAKLLVSSHRVNCAMRSLLSCSDAAVCPFPLSPGVSIRDFVAANSPRSRSSASCKSALAPLGSNPYRAGSRQATV